MLQIAETLCVGAFNNEVCIINKTMLSDSFSW
jgi:hypothetical protein